MPPPASRGFFVIAAMVIVERVQKPSKDFFNGNSILSIKNK
jgi:hypothetical protein